MSIEVYCDESRQDLFCNTKSISDNNRRVAIISEDNYVVIIQIIKYLKAKFITAYVADSPHTALAIRENPTWVKK